ncbi:uncharacterized protein LOC108472164 [Gossypium arboreum]|uniref:uncharacterized protein LOC108472164 n=1 Tax=Gossypium arboreum TaxID=29729 RepID=UPI000819167D|nr:uncharacterized protein LOC108472164 [Gossypium arboreum]
MASSSFSPAAPPFFNGEGYHIWVVKMRTYLQAFDLWEVVNSDAEPAPLRANPIVAQIRQHADERTERHKAMSCIQNCVSDVIFTRIMAYKTPKQAWDRLKEEFQGTERTRQQQLLNLKRDFEDLKIKEEETVRQYSNRIMAMVNSIRLFGEQFNEARIVEKRKEEPAYKRSTRTVPSKLKQSLTRVPLPTKARKLGETDQSHVERVCKEKGRPRQNQQQPRDEARVAKEDSDNEEQVFAVSCSAAQEKISNGWLLDSGCTNHMSPNTAIFKFLDRSCKTKVKVGNGYFIKAEGKGDVVVCTPIGNKIISNVLLVPEIDRNLLSIAQLLERGYTVVFKENECQISDPSGFMLMSVAM